MAQSNETYDLAVIGGGPGGYVAAIRAAQLGMKSAVIEKERVGGLCLNWGCIPSKALLRSAEVYHLIQNADDFGIKVGDLKFDSKKIIKRSRAAADKLSRGVEYLLKKNKVTHISGTARVAKKGVIEVSKNGKDDSKVNAKNIVIATGGYTRSLPGVEIDKKKVISSREALVLDNLPKSIVIIGGGPIGVEFAYFYNAFGAECTIVEMMPHILPFEDTEIIEILEKNFKKNKIELLTNTKVETVKTTSKGVTVNVGGKEGGSKELKADIALMAVGFGGFVEGLGLDELGVEIEKSFIKVDDNYKTNVDGVYAIGDVIGPPLLAHVASAEGLFMVEKMAGLDPLPVNYSNIPSCTYCQPQVASIGMTEQKAKDEGYNVKIGRFPFRANGKSIAVGETEGMVKLVFDEKYGELLGAHIIGIEATDMIAELGVAKTLESTHKEVLKTVHAHPTLTEAVMEAAGEAYGEAIHI
ncbi:dihydrolipoyl dehydrogenase [candidate division KSB1 bacterium]|nr:dihydrolipoyl dehydrogenase [candidate division KSB1 bacterium]NIR71281.1 dihydrolipoyl dehydrogenase [candidate division KSB1 bacterium]NIS24810.1 dihydrolipoyl dehydrogenase [candidate division KSB1 bacterium]NIT71717.1 dihydrolipoyl dehydrogenase [candidate division KSB1 bacterium]NIU25446.1 dihydrolipoyl dehydrogenase [candidate division KSB1 bacterium]